MLHETGVVADMSNAGPVNLTGLDRLIPAAVDEAQAVLSQTTRAAERHAEATVDAWAERAQSWAHDSDALIQRGDIRTRRASVEQVRQLAEARRPDCRYLRPLLVIVPTDHPVAKEGA